jgi:hypothetical protein
MLRTLGVCKTWHFKWGGLLPSKNLLNPSLYSRAIRLSNSAVVNSPKSIKLWNSPARDVPLAIHVAKGKAFDEEDAIAELSHDSGVNYA